MKLLIIFAVVTLVVLVYRFSYRADYNKHFVTDYDGRILIFHGINVISSAKSDPLRVGGTTKDDFLRISKRWGFNAVRLLIFWDGIEPQRGQYDQEYLLRVRQRLDWCAEAGLFVILDIHQDLYALRYGGDGAPEWAIQDDGQPFEYQTPWEMNYLQPAVKAAISNFWRIENGYPELQDHFIDAMMVAVDAFASHPAVIGIDLYNEPTMATLHGIFNLERRYLTPLLQRAIDTIRKNHSDIWIFFEPSAVGPNQGFRSSLGKLKDPRAGNPRLVYFPHIYTLDLDIGGKYLGWPLFIKFWAHQRKKEARKFNTPMMVGEFGLSEDEPGALKFLDAALKMFDQITSGWFYWSYDRGSWGLENQEREELQKVDVLVRPYPQKIGGTEPRFCWYPEDRIFSLSYNSVTSDDSSNATEIYLPSRAWPGGWKLINKGVNISQAFDSARQVLTISPIHPGKVMLSIQSKT